MVVDGRNFRNDSEIMDQRLADIGRPWSLRLLGLKHQHGCRRTKYRIGVRGSEFQWGICSIQ